MSAANALGEINVISESQCSDDLKPISSRMNLPKVKDASKAKFKLGVSDPKGQLHRRGHVDSVRATTTWARSYAGVATHFSRFIKGLKDGDYEEGELGLARTPTAAPR